VVFTQPSLALIRVLTMTPAWFGRAGLGMILAALIFGAGSAGPFSSVPFGVGVALIVCTAHEVLVLRAIRR
jgi:hypothetical protein